MYLEASLTFDPSASTVLQRIKPTRAFARLGYYLSFGLTGARGERETFTAVAVLQQLHLAARAVGIDDIIRIAVDDEDVYIDREGRPDDLRVAMDLFASQVANAPRDREFESLTLVLEHRDAELRYFIEIWLSRLHAPGEHPIKVRITGVVPEFAQVEREAAAAIFADQQQYEALVARKRAAFAAFVEGFRASVRANIPCDGDWVDSSLRIVRSNARGRGAPPSGMRVGGHPGVDQAFMYTWWWADMCHVHHVHVHDVHIVDEGGRRLQTVDTAGTDAGTMAMFDATFVEPVVEPPTAGFGVDAVSGASVAEDETARDLAWLTRDLHHGSPAVDASDGGSSQCTGSNDGGSSQCTGSNDGGSSSDSGGSSSCGSCSGGSSCSSSSSD